MKDDRNDEFWGHQFFIGENPPADAVIQFHLKKPVPDLRLKITDATGSEMRELAVPANRNAGRHPDRVLGHAALQPIAPAGEPAGTGGRAAAARPAAVVVAVVAVRQARRGAGGPAAASPEFRRRCPFGQQSR